MLAVVVRRNSFPVVLIARPATLQLSPLLARRVERASMDADTLAEAAAAAIDADLPLPASAPGAINVRSLDPAEMAAGRSAMTDRLERGLTGAEVAALSDQDAQILSVIGSNPGTRLVTLADGGLRIETITADDAAPQADQPAHASAGHRPRSFCINFPGGQPTGQEPRT